MEIINQNNQKFKFMHLQYLLFLLIILIFLTSNVSAIGLGASPATFYFDIVKPGGFSQKTILISTTGTNVSVTASATGALARWIEFDREFIVSINNPYRLMVSLNLPEDLGLIRSYTGTLRFITGHSGEVEEIGSFVRAGVEVQLVVRLLFCEATFDTTIDEGNAILEINLFNKGNVRFSPVVTVDVWDSDIENLIRQTSIRGEDLPPSTREEFFVELGKLKPGKYWAEVKVEECSYSKLVKVDIKSDSQITSEEGAESETLKKEKIRLKDVFTSGVYVLIVIFIIFFVYRIIKDRREREKEEYNDQRI